MPSFQRFLVNASRKYKKDIEGQALPVDTEELLIVNKIMCIERVPNNKVFQIFGEQTNTKATYCLYLEINDPELPQHTTINWVMYGKTYTGKVKLTLPYSQLVMNRRAECYIQSDNE
jgi:hypothetical protein